MPKPPWAALTFHTEPEAALDGAEFVQESAPEREELKRALLARLDAVLDPEIVIASSSSGLLMSRLQNDCRHPQRCVIGHPFNPPHPVPLVEVVGGEKTGSVAIERALAFYSAIGKQPIHVVPGHVANRLQAALWREALHLVAEGIASVADVDTAISAGPGLRWALMGPHLTFHLAGGVGGIDHFLDQFAAPMANWWESSGNPTLTSELKERLAEGITAEVTGRGIAELAAWRDRFLVDLLALRRRADEQAGKDYKHWSQIAEEWLMWARKPNHDAFWAYRASLTAFIGRGDGKALDVGCGEGRISRELTACGFHVTAVDPVSRFVIAAIEAQSARNYAVASATELPFENAQFGLVVAYNVLMDVDDVPSALKEFRRVIRPGGQLIISVCHPFVDRGRFASNEMNSLFVLEGTYFGRQRFDGVEERDGLRMHFAAGWSQPLEAYGIALEEAGLAITSLREPSS